MNQIDGLPAHVLLVHAVVVLVPVTALLALSYAFWPGGRSRLRWPLLGCAAVSVGFNVLAMQAGEWLQQRVPATPLVRAHTRLGDGLLPWTFGLLVFSAVVGAVALRARRSPTPRWARPARSKRLGLVVRYGVPAVAVVLASGALVQTYRIGETGAKAVWHGRVSVQPLPVR